ncbi:hypothetical protein ELH67_10915 [Rhizobium ruizarguesonis]|uniref:hypothetical protein n=1 Tax=Rhizobium ruizarguesonis TaxID=2081791 RepID=UPI001030D035|nr:hypothetical protein [Rhizobium ruizarguesonis]TAZ95011.1 hypothetical protein ELH67_10915 [Rhizobium ruizarguesonis]TBA37891.1 hypothetical protein ELH60_10910 [Rhizobium ruizarguesonis]TBC63247.1 hypothetical protein ELH36_10920 [Rhizobium ruizarguesonis]
MSATSRERQRRYRDRRKAGLRIVRLVVDDVALSVVLEALHFLDPQDADDDQALERGLNDMIRVLCQALADDA